MDQVNADSQSVVHALDMLFGQPANVFCQPLLIKRKLFKSVKAGKQIRISKKSFDEWLDTF